MEAVKQGTLVIADISGYSRYLSGAGTTNHCLHGREARDEEILDWKPFSYITLRVRTRGVRFMCTFELTPVDDATTRFTARVVPDGGRARNALFRLALPRLQKAFDSDLARLAHLLGELGAAERQV